MGKIGNGIIFVGRIKRGIVFHVIHSRINTALDLSRGGAGKNTDEFTGQFGVGVVCPTVERLGVDHADFCLFGGFIQGGISHVVTVSGQHAHTSVAGRQLEFFGHIRIHIGNQPDTEYTCA